MYGPRILRRSFLHTGGACALTLIGSEPCLAATWADTHNSGPFMCYANFSLKQHTHALDQLSALQRDLVRILGIRVAQESVQVYILHDKAAYTRFLQHYFPEVPYRRALYVKERGPGRILTFRHEKMAEDIRHEATHGLLHAVLPMVPLWLDEGLAEYFELSEEKRARGHAHLRALKWNMRLGLIPPLATLEKKQSLREMGPLEYRFSWAWVHFMLHGPRPAHGALVSYLADVQNFTPPGRLSDRLVEALPEVDRRMVEHFKHWR